MELKNKKLGDKFYGIVYKYDCRFLKGIKIVECEVIKINPKTIGISFDVDTRKYPPLYNKNKDYDTMDDDKKRLAHEYLTFLSTCKYPDYLKEKITKYCKRIINKRT